MRGSPVQCYFLLMVVLYNVALSYLRSQFFTIQTNSKPENNKFIFCYVKLVSTTNGVVYTTLSLNQLTCMCCLIMIC